MEDRLERNKRTVMVFYDLMFNVCKLAEAMERYAGEVYIQHNPMVADGKQAFSSRAYVKRFRRTCIMG